MEVSISNSNESYVNNNSNDVMHYCRKVFKILCETIIAGLFFSIIIFLMLLYHNKKGSTFSNNFSHLCRKKSINNKFLRKNFGIDITKLSKNIKNYYTNEFAFVLNLSSYEYLGEWESLKDQQKFFKKSIKNGVAELIFSKNNLSLNSTYLTEKYNENTSFNIFLVLKEGKYIDKNIKVNYTFTLPSGVNFTKLLKENKTFQFTNTGKNLIVNYNNFLISRNVVNIKNSNLTLVFHNELEIFESNYQKLIYSHFKKVDCIISSNDFSIKLQTNLRYDEELEYKVRVFSFILSSVGLLEIYFILKLLINVSENSTIGQNLDLITICSSCFYKSIIYCMNFSLSVSSNNEDISYQFGVPSIIYFFAITGFEHKLFVYSWRARYIERYFNDMEWFKKYVWLFYIMFYAIWTIFMIYIKEFLTNYTIILLYFSTIWLFQIIFSAKNGSRPPMSRSYIFFLSLCKLYLPIYLKGIDGNIFDLRPSYFKTFLLCSVVFFQTVILLMQKSFGGKVILPKKFRQNEFNYYKDKVDIDKHISQNPNCVICLEELSKNVDANMNVINTEEEALKKKRFNIKFINTIVRKFEVWILNLEGKPVKKKYMITPCDHVFHTNCLEKWMSYKNECPYCKSKIPNFG